MRYYSVNKLIALVVFGLGMLQGVAKANDVYISQSGGGAGSSCSSPLVYTYFNNSKNWTSGAPSGTQIGPGTTVHLCGTFTGVAGQQFLSAQGSGTSGKPVTIKFEPNAVMQAPYLSASSAIYLSGQSYITVDGGTNGIIQNTLNGSSGATCPGGSCSYQQSSVAIQALPGSNDEFKNLTVANLYVHAQCELSSGCDTVVDQTQVNAIQFRGSNILIHDNTFHDIGWVLFQNATNGDTGIQIYNNNFYNMDHGMAIGAPANDTVSAMFVYNNHFHDMANWDTGTADAYHHDGIHAFSTSPGKIQNLYIYNNLFDGNEGNCCVTGWVFLEGGAQGTPWTDATGTAYVWNNVIIGSLDVPNSNVYIGNGSGHEVLNNTIVVASPNGGGCLGFHTGATNVIAENNAIEGCNAVINSSDAASYSTIDYQAYGNASGGSPIWQFATENANTLPTWQPDCTCDSHSQATLSSTLALSSEGVPQTGYIGILKGVNLTSLATGYLASLASDTSAGNTHTPVGRPATGPWDVGAYQYSGAPNPPTALVAVAH